MNCVNISHPRYEELLKELKDPIDAEIVFSAETANNGYSLDKTKEGKESKLYKDLLSITNDKVEALRAKAKTFTDEFQEWFDESKVIDDNGEPLMVYHGTPTKYIKTGGTLSFEEVITYNKNLKELYDDGTIDRNEYLSGVNQNKKDTSTFEEVGFNTFDKKRIGSKQGTDFGEGFYFGSYNMADASGTTIMPVFLNISSIANIHKNIQDGNVKGDVYVAFEPNQIKSVFNTGEFSKENDNIYYQNVEGYDDVVSPFEKMTKDKQAAFEKTVRDLSARIADRIGIKYEIINDKSQKFKGKLEGNTAVINLAYATLDTPIHEILGHPIIRAIKNRSLNSETSTSELYNNLLEELSTSKKGKEVFDRIKRDYVDKTHSYYTVQNEDYTDLDNINEIRKERGLPLIVKPEYLSRQFKTKEEASSFAKMEKPQDKYNITIKENVTKRAYTSEEQQEEAIVELLGLYTADRLDKVKDGKLISLLKRLLKEMKVYMKSLFNAKEVEIDKLPDNMTLGDIADLLAYSNSKLILPGNEVVYTTPDNQTFKTYQEASNHISDLTKLGEVDFNDHKTIQPFYGNTGNEYFIDRVKVFKKEGKWYKVVNNKNIEISIKEVKELYKTSNEFYNFKSFVSKNKEYEQSKEIIEEWKKVNDIKYDPEEIYSRGQGFYSVVGAYSEFDVELMFQNLLTHIEDNKKAGGEFSISAFTKPVDKNIGHLEGGGGKIKFKIFPKSNDIKWAANTDVYSGSVWDASEKVNKDKKSEIIGVSYTKSPSLSNIDSVQPNLANIIDNLAHHHNELGIELTGNNFRLEYDDNVPYSTKKLLDKINSILDSKFGKLVEPEISTDKKLPKVNNINDIPLNEIPIYYDLEDSYYFKKTNKIWKAAETIGEFNAGNVHDINPQLERILLNEYNNNLRLNQSEGKQPTQTKENLKESIEDISSKISESQFTNDNQLELDYLQELSSEGNITPKQESRRLELLKLSEGKVYTSQAEINTKAAALKYGQRKFPRSLIRSEVRKAEVLSDFQATTVEEDMFTDELPFQKVPSKEPITVKEVNSDYTLPKVSVTEDLGSNWVDFRKSLTSESRRILGSLIRSKEVKIRC